MANDFIQGEIIRQNGVINTDTINQNNTQFNDTPMNDKDWYAILKYRVDNEVAYSIVVTPDTDNDRYKIELKNCLLQTLSTQYLSSSGTKGLTNVVLNYAQKKLVFTRVDGSTIECDVSSIVDRIENHIANTNNPHSVTKAQVGLSNVDNTSDTNKPLSVPQKTYVDTADTTLQTNITNEVTRATTKESQIEASVSTETTNRQNADTTLQTNINNEATSRANADTTITNNLNSEISSRESADTVLTNAIQTEVSNRQSADNTLQTNITNEANARTSADTTLQTNINNEVSARQNAVSSEATIRENKDDELETAIETEATTRQSEDTRLDQRIDNVSARGRYLTYWYCDTHTVKTYPVPTSYPYTYTYKTGDYYIVGRTGTTNYRPSGTSITKQSAEAQWNIPYELETDPELTKNSTYIFDNNQWSLIPAGVQPEIPVKGVTQNGTDVVDANGIARVVVPITLSDLSEDTTHKTVTQEEKTNIANNTTARHTHSNKGVLDNLTQGVIDNSHTHSNKELLDTYTQTELNLADAVTKKHTHSNKGVLDNLTQEVIDNSHTHSNKELLDTYTQTETNLADAVSKKHNHSNKTVLDNLSQGVIDNSHSHTNKTTLDGIASTNLVSSSDRTNWNGKQPAGSYMTLDTEQTATAKKTFSYTEPIVLGGQETILNVLSTRYSSQMNAQWCGRMKIGNRDKTFLLGVYRQAQLSQPAICGIGAHSWNDSFEETGASWEDIYLEPDGDKAVYIGGRDWRANSGWLKVQNNGSDSASFRTYINTSTAISPIWRTVLPNMATGNYSIFFSPYISNTHAKTYCTSLGYGAIPTNNYVTNIGYNATGSGQYGTSIGYNAKANASYAVQLGYGTNSTANTFNVGLSSSNNYQLLNASGKIPNERLQVINDNSTTSTTETWSANKLNTTIGDIEATLQAIRGVS